MDNMKNVLHMDNVTMQFGGVVAVNGLSLDVNEHEIVALIGPNGAGKTTAFNCVTGIYQPTFGSVSFNGEVILADTPQGKMRRLYEGDITPTDLTPVRKTPDQVTKLGIARTFQNIRLFGALTVFENVLIAKHMRAKQNVFSATLRLNHAEEKLMREESMELLEMQGLAHLKNEIASSLPYGLQRRLEIARALATSPSLLLLDEPVSGIDQNGMDLFYHTISELKRHYDLAIILISHDLDYVAQYADQVILIDGTVKKQGTVRQVYESEEFQEIFGKFDLENYKPSRQVKEQKEKEIAMPKHNHSLWKEDV